MRNYILKIICSLTIISVIGFSGVSIFSNKVVYAEEITTITNDEEVESKLNNLYDYINTMKRFYLLRSLRRYAQSIQLLF